jgi:hypothetical protein
LTALMRSSALVFWSLAAEILLAASPAQANWFDIPEGFVATQESQPEVSDPPAATKEWRNLMTVRPEPGPFSDLSEVNLRQVIGQLEEPDEWLERRVTAELVDHEVMEDVLESPDSPFADPMFDLVRDAIPQLYAGIQELSKLPLRFCDGPLTAYNASGPLRELNCTYQLGPFRQYFIFRLQQVEGAWYYTEIRAMNEKRLRHLIAIANSFKPSA